MGTSFTWNIFFIHTPIFTNVNRGYILGEVHRVSTQLLDENACTSKYNSKHNIKLTTKNQKAISEISRFSFFVIIIANINLAYWMIYLICTLK